MAVAEKFNENELNEALQTAEETVNDVASAAAEEALESAVEGAAGEAAEDNADETSGEEKKLPEGIGETLVYVDHVTREFRRKEQQIVAVNDVSMDIKRGSFVILCGKSGSGKTTLLNLIAAIDMPTSGTVSFEGKAYDKLSENGRDNLRRTNMGIVFQNTALMSNMSAIENVEFALSIAGIHSAKRRNSSIIWLEKMGIIGRALAHSPKLLLADEPTAELDTRTSFEVVKMFRNLVDEEGLTIIMTTHDVNIMGVADIIYTLEDGRVVDVRENKKSG